MLAHRLALSRGHLQIGAAILALIVLAVAVLAACDRSSSGQAKGTASIGALTITHARLPAPASPDQAVLYLDVRNSSATPDELVGLSAAFAGGGMLMHDQTSGTMQQMQPVDALTIPAHGQASLSPGAYHAMLVKLTTPLKQGQSVMVTLQFKLAGNVTFAVPVTSYTQQ